MKIIEQNNLTSHLDKEQFLNNKKDNKKKIYIDSLAINQFLKFEPYHSFQSYEQFFEFFSLNEYNFDIILDQKKEEDIDFCIYEIHLDDKDKIPDKKQINIMISIENLTKWPWYNHYNKYGEYGNEKIDIYFYNHISKIIQNEKMLVIPTIYCFMNYLTNHYSKLKPNKITEWENKKFCLVINKSKLNPEIEIFRKIVSHIGKVDSIDLYKDSIGNKSCYFSIELLNIFNQYKFILCFENSYQNGYITEKIFNCFFSRTIPIYKGDPNINKYFNHSSFIDTEFILNKENSISFLKKIKNISEDKNIYLSYINSVKINNNFNDESYKEKLKDFIESKKYCNN